jgi:hypothetical protein
MEAQQESLKSLTENLRDQWWRLNNLYYVMNEKGEKVKFKPNFAQADFYSEMWFLNIILKARQLGFTTFIDIFLLDVCLFNSNIRAGIITVTMPIAKKVFRDKVKFAFDNLPAVLRERLAAKTENTNELMFSNGSSISVSTTMRGLTCQYLHISEFGKICAKYPARAEEIVSGALNTVHAGMFVFIESTAEGQAGQFYDMTQEALNLQRLGRPLNEMQYKFHFYPWYMDLRYQMKPDSVIITDDDNKYFDQLLQRDGIELTAEQKAWYVAKKAIQKAKMKREYPTTPKEAFEVAIEGAWYGKEMERVREEGRICKLPFYPNIPVNTFWDLGRNDLNAIWLHQRVGAWNHFIKYYENKDYPLAHYVKYLRDWANEKGAIFGKHFIPHDGEHETVGMEKNVYDQLWDMGLRNIETVERIGRVNDGIEMVRNAFPTYRFDEEGTPDGIKCLDSYRREWDDKLATFKDTPLHDWASNGADALRQHAQGYVNNGVMTDEKRRKKKAKRRTSAMTA